MILNNIRTEYKQVLQKEEAVLLIKKNVTKKCKKSEIQ
jgi:hypothetical protein